MTVLPGIWRKGGETRDVSEGVILYAVQPAYRNSHGDADLKV